MGYSRLLPFLGAVLLVGCIGSPAVLRTGPAAIQQGPLPPLDSPGDSPYRAPEFNPLPVEAEAGRWELIQPAAQPGALPTPTPEPTPSRLPGESSEYVPLDIHVPNRSMTLNVGDSLQLKAFSSEQGPNAPIRWGVLETERGVITPEGLLTTFGPGPLHVYAELQGKRRYVLFAVKDPALQAQDVPGAYARTSMLSYGTYSYLFRSRESWDGYWSHLPSPPPLPSGFDFETQTLVYIHVYTSNDGEARPVVTRIRQEGGTVVEAVVSDSAPQVCSCDPHDLVSITAVPRLPEDAQVEVVRNRGTEKVSTSGPTPTPSPSPTPTPDPLQVLPSGAPTRPPRPPYPPPSLTGDPNACPPYSIHDGSAHPPFTVTWFGQPVSEPWEPLLAPGASMKLFIQGDATGVRWSSVDPRMATVTQDGTVTALRAGAIRVRAEGAGQSITIMLPSQASPAPALRFRFRADWNTPKADAPRGTRIIRSDSEWATLWKTNFLYNLPWSPPPVDFSRYDVIALVDDRRSYGEGTPVLTHVSDSGRVAHLVFSGIANPASGGAYHQATFLFLTGKLAPEATVRVHTLCDP